MKKLTFVKLSGLYGNYQRDFRRRFPSLEKESYAKQHETLMRDGFAWADFWKTNLEKTGLFEATEIVTDYEPLQKKWAEENGVRYSEKDWKREILLAQMKRLAPDVLFANDRSLIADIRRENPRIKLVIGWDGLMIGDAKSFEGCDAVLSCDRPMSEYYGKNGKIGYYFPFGFEASLDSRIQHNRELYDLSFVGSVLLGNDYHDERLKLLGKLSKEVRLDTWIPSLPAWGAPFDKFWVRQVLDAKPRQYGDALRLMARNHRGEFGIGMYQTIADSKVTLNIHPNNKSATMRLFEATGAGSCLVTDDHETVREFFEPGKEVVIYEGPEDAIDKAKHLLANDSERRKITEAARERVLREHTFEARVREFAKFIIPLLQ